MGVLFSQWNPCETVQNTVEIKTDDDANIKPAITNEAKTQSTTKKDNPPKGNPSKKSMRVALFGGSFDPPHRGHEALVRKVLDMKELEIDEVWILPAQLNPDKVNNPVKGEHRLAMLQLIFKDEKRIHISDWELQRPGKSYTFDTLTHFTTAYPDYKFHFVMGSDQRFGSWDRCHQTAAMVDFIIVSRAGHQANPSEIFHGVEEAKYKIVNFHDESNSSAVREDIEAGQYTTGVIHSVLMYILEHQLYAKDDDALAKLRASLGSFT